MSDSCDPTDCSLPGSSAHGILQARILEWGAIAFSTGLLTLWNYVRNQYQKRFGNNPHIFRCSVTFIMRDLWLSHWKKRQSFKLSEVQPCKNILCYHCFSPVALGTSGVFVGTTLSLDDYLGSAGVRELRFCARLTQFREKDSWLSYGKKTEEQAGAATVFSLPLLLSYCKHAIKWCDRLRDIPTVSVST